MTKESIEELIKQSIPDAKVSIEDLRGDGDHYSATVISRFFDGKSKVDQHKMVYESLKYNYKWNGDPARRSTHGQHGKFKNICVISVIFMMFLMEKP